MRSHNVDDGGVRGDRREAGGNEWGGLGMQLDEEAAAGDQRGGEPGSGSGGDDHGIFEDDDEL